MSSISKLLIQPSTLAELEGFAVQRSADPEALVDEVLLEGIAAIRERLFWEERRKGVDVQKGIDAFNRMGKNNPPDPGDELPEDLKYLLNESR